jgi:hypothetical protein
MCGMSDEYKLNKPERQYREVTSRQRVQQRAELEDAMRDALPFTFEPTISAAKMFNNRAKAERRLKRYPNNEVGDYAAYEDLVSGGGKFYGLGDQRFCDMPTMTFELEDIYWKRIE